VKNVSRETGKWGFLVFVVGLEMRKLNVVVFGGNGGERWKMFHVKHFGSGDYI
jgi:hypothetical protein